MNKLIFAGLIMLFPGAPLFAAGGNSNTPAADSEPADTEASGASGDTHGSGNSQGEHDGTAPDTLLPVEPDAEEEPSAAPAVQEK